MLGFASFASVGGLGRGTATGGIVLGAGEGALTVVEEGALTVVDEGALTVAEEGALTVAETVSTASGFSTDAGTTGFGGVDVAVVAFAEVVEDVPEVGGTAAVAGAVVVGVAGAVVVATAEGAGQR